MVAAWRTGIVVALVTTLALLGTLPAVLALPPAPVHAGASPVPPFSSPVAGGPTAARSHPPPPLSCPPGYPAYVNLPGEVWPLDPNFAYQGPCRYIAEDEVHASFASGASGSGARWSIPWTLPAEGIGGQENIEEGLYVGMVVSGNGQSMWNQSYLEVLATPSLNLLSQLTWNVNLSVLSFVNMTYFHPAGCPAGALNLSWNDTYFCEIDDLANGAPLSLLSGVAGERRWPSRSTAPSAGGRASASGSTRRTPPAAPTSSASTPPRPRPTRSSPPTARRARRTAFSTGGCRTASASASTSAPSAASRSPRATPTTGRRTRPSRRRRGGSPSSGTAPPTPVTTGTSSRSRRRASATPTPRSASPSPAATSTRATGATASTPTSPSARPVSISVPPTPPR